MERRKQASKMYREASKHKHKVYELYKKMCGTCRLRMNKLIYKKKGEGTIMTYEEMIKTCCKKCKQLLKGYE